MAMKPEDLRKMTPGQRAALKKAELAARLKAQMKKPAILTGTRPGTKTPIPSGPRKPKTTAKPAPAGPKKKPKLDDFLLKGKKPPMKIKPGLKRPSDADVILKGYNDKKYKGK
jgi:hypothetical protein